MEKKERYDGLDGLRTYAILGIVLMHVLENGGYQKTGFVLERLIPSFTNLVFVFMAISAFGMCCGYYNSICSGNISIDAFYSNRYKKIWPYFALLCLIDVVSSPSIDAIYELFANLTLCFGLLPNANISVIGVGWTLGVIFSFYLLFPFFCYLIRNRGRAWFVFIIALAFNYISGFYFNCNKTSIIYSGIYFIIGGIIYLYREQLKVIVEKKKIFAWLVVVLTVVLYFVIASNTVTMLMVSAALLVYALGIHQGGVLLNPFTRFISRISFEIYLCHMVIYRVIEKLHFTHIVDNDVISYVITYIGTIVGAVIFSVVMQWGIKIIMSSLKKG